MTHLSKEIPLEFVDQGRELLRKNIQRVLVQELQPCASKQQFYPLHGDRLISDYNLDTHNTSQTR